MPAGNAYIKLDEVITAAAQELGQIEFGALGKPFFISAAQRGLQEMNYLTQFHQKQYIAEIPDSLIMPLPGDLTEKDQVYVASMDGCNISSSTILFIKPNMWHLGGEGYFAQNKGRNHDPMQYSLTWSEAPPGRLYFAGERDGTLFLSPGCKLNFGTLVIPYSGIGVDEFGEDFRVPQWCREAITDFIIHRAALALERGDPQYMRGVIQRKQYELTDPHGSWFTASGRFKRMDKKTRYDTAAYNFRFGHY
jgi:hypothetical protein